MVIDWTHSMGKAGRHLLFALIALQVGLIDQTHLVAVLLT